MPVVARLLISLIALLIALGGIAVVMTWGLTRLDTGGSTYTTWDVPLDGASSLTTNVRVDAGRVDLGPTLPAGDPLATGVAMRADVITPNTAPSMVNWYPSQGDNAFLDIATTSTSLPATVLRWIREPGATEWDIALTPDVPLDLQVDVLRGAARIDLTGMTLTDLQVQVGVGSVEIVTDGASGSGSVRIGVGDARILVPEGTPLRIDTGGSTSILGSDGFNWDGGSLVNAAWQELSNPADGLSLVVEAGAGSVNLVTLYRADSPTVGDSILSPVPNLGPGPADPTSSRSPLTSPRPIGDGTHRRVARLPSEPPRRRLRSDRATSPPHQWREAPRDIFDCQFPGQPGLMSPDHLAQRPRDRHARSVRARLPRL